MAGRRGAVRSHQQVVARSVRRPAPVQARASDLDRLIHERTRLAIVSALAVNDVLSFNELKAITETSDGNLSVHSRKLEEAGYLRCTKTFDGRVPKTEFRLADLDGMRFRSISITWKRSSGMPGAASPEICSFHLRREAQGFRLQNRGLHDPAESPDEISRPARER